MKLPSVAIRVWTLESACVITSLAGKLGAKLSIVIDQAIGVDISSGKIPAHCLITNNHMYLRVKAARTQAIAQRQGKVGARDGGQP